MPEEPLWKTDPEQWLERILSCAQKARSIQLEAFGDLPGAEEVLESLDPWLFGEKCVIPVLIFVTRFVTKSGRLRPGDGMNLVTVLQRSPGWGTEVMSQGIKIPGPMEFYRFLAGREKEDG